MELSPWLSDLKADQLPEPYRTIAYEFTLNTALKFAANYQGTGMYFPKLDTLLQSERNKRIHSEFNGSNHKALAVKYGITERWVYDIIGEQPDDRQTSLFEDNS